MLVIITGITVIALVVAGRGIVRVARQYRLHVYNDRSRDNI